MSNAVEAPARDQQIRQLQEEFAAASGRARAVCDGLDTDALMRRPSPDRWSVAECLAHLNQTTEAYLPQLDSVIASANPLPHTGDEQLRMDWVGRLLNWSLRPPARLRMKTMGAFRNLKVDAPETVLTTFLQLQQELARRLDQASNVDMNRTRIKSVFNERMQYNLYSCFHIIATHQVRHLWQAEQVRKAIGTAA